MSGKDNSAPKIRQEIQESLIQKVSAKEARKLKARREKAWSIWFGLGMIGIVGWSVAIPTLIGVAAGIWIDATWPSRFSWTLTLLLVGMTLGCLNAWHWVAQQQKQIEQSEEEQNDG